LFSSDIRLIVVIKTVMKMSWKLEIGRWKRRCQVSVEVGIKENRCM